MRSGFAARWAILCIVGLALTAPLHRGAAADDSAYRRAVDQRFTRWVAELWPQAQSRGISRATFASAMDQMRPDWSLPDLQPLDLGPGAPSPPQAEQARQHRAQPEFSVPADYFAPGGLNLLVQLGRQHMARWRDTLTEIERRFGVEPHVVLAIWGRETAFGRASLPHNAVRAIATQAFMGRRKEMFREELLLALTILEEGHVPMEQMSSSWAGAMGHAQFLPSDFTRHAVDITGDGKRDIWTSVPDALASAANALRHKGWQPGQTWGYEIRLPEGVDCALEGPRHARPIAAWAAMGITRTFDRAFPPHRQDEEAFLVLPAGRRGPAFLALDNFMVLKGYNFADLYALYVGHLADRIVSDRGFETPWQPVPGFGRDEVRVLQEHMAARGIDIGPVDGLLGHRTRASIGLLQRHMGLPVDCYPNRELLAHARREANTGAITNAPGAGPRPGQSGQHR